MRQACKTVEVRNFEEIGPPAGLKRLAEEIILLSIEDFSGDELHKASREFFEGRDFLFWAEIAGMGSGEQTVLRDLLGLSVMK